LREPSAHGYRLGLKDKIGRLPRPAGRLYLRLPRNRSFSLSCAFARRGPRKWSKFGPGTPVRSASHSNQADHRQHAHPFSPFAPLKPFEVAHQFAVALVQLGPEGPRA